MRRQFRFSGATATKLIIEQRGIRPGELAAGEAGWQVNARMQSLARGEADAYQRNLSDSEAA